MTTIAYFVETRDAMKARRALDAQKVRYSEKPWQAGIRCFEIDDRDTPKLHRVFG